jgi:hypothetical protein
MMAHVSATVGGSMECAAAAVKAQVLVIVSVSDHMVTPGQLWNLLNGCKRKFWNCVTIAVISPLVARSEK